MKKLTEIKLYAVGFFDEPDVVIVVDTGCGSYLKG